MPGPDPSRYRELKLLGAGGMATVTLAEDTILGRQVALKRLHARSDPVGLKRFRREGLVGASLNHPNLVSVYDVFVEEEGDVVIVMQYVAGDTLRELIRRRGALPANEALQILEGVAAGLDAIHARGIVHRDVKPANILLGSDVVKLADLGTASVGDRTQITTAGAVVGTFSYMAPEQLEGSPSQPAMDIYALAAVGFEMLGGKKARSETNPLALAHAISTRPPPDLRDHFSEASEATARVLQAGMASKPSDRPRSAGELARRLRESLAPTLPQPAPTRRRSPGVGAAPAAAAAAAAPALRSHRQPRRSAPRVQTPVASPAPAARAAPVTPAASPKDADSQTPATSPAGAGSRSSAGSQASAAAPASPPPSARAGGEPPSARTPEQDRPRQPPVGDQPATGRSADRRGRLAVLLPLVAALVIAGVITGLVLSGGGKSGTAASGSRAGTRGTSGGAGATASSTGSTAGASTTAANGSSATSGTSGTLSASTPAGAVQSFYEDAARHDYSAAWSLADQNMRNQLEGYGSFQAQMSAVRSITFNQVATVPSTSASIGTVQVHTTSVLVDKTQQCAGTARTVKSATGTWLLDGISIDCTSE